MRGFWAFALKIGFVLGSTLVFIPVAVAQAKPDAKAILKSVSDTNLKQYEFTVRMTLEQVSKAGEKQIDTKTFKLAVQRPDRIRMELENDDTLFGEPVSTGGPAGPMLLVGDGKSVWVYAPELKKYGKVTSRVNQEAEALVTNPSNWVTMVERGLFAPVQSGLANADPVKPVGEERIVLDGKEIDCYVIDASPEVLTMWVDKRNYLVAREVIREVDGLTTTDFLLGRVNMPLPADLFLFTPRPDAKEEDMALTRNPFQ
jgi:outer membrane lipoprotein-sorting protein